jgi:putative CocE/NonD family hydrolase
VWTVAVAVAAAHGQAAPAPASGAPFPMPSPRYEVRIEQSVMVPMRDGVRLSTDLYFPVGVEGRLPVILMRTPYNKNAHRVARSIPNMFAGQGYAVAVQDVRGKFESEGDYIISAADVNDGYDATSWAAAQAWSNGKVGTIGCSYLGDVQVMQARARNPHLAAMVPAAAGSSIPYRYFGVVEGGVYELLGGFNWFRGFGSKVYLRFPPGTPDSVIARSRAYFNPAPTVPNVNSREMLETLPVIDVMRRAGAPPTDFEATLSHEPADPWWAQLNYLQPTDTFDTPSLQVNSWHDFGIAETLYQFNLMRTNAATPRGRDNQFIIISPTAHCQSERASARTIVGERDMGDARFDYWRTYLDWFDFWLKGVDNGVTRMPKVRLYVMGRNQWRAENEWPLARTRYTNYYFDADGRANSRSAGGTLGTAAPRRARADTIVYDPRHPVPTVGGPVCCTVTPDSPEGSYDQSAVENREDVLVYTTPALTTGVEVTGPVKVVLYVSSDAKDTDFTAKLVDVYPDGRAFNVQEGILRARYREGWNKKVWMEPGKVYEVTIDLHATSNYFAPGHRIRVDVSSSNFPRFDRNLNTGGRNYDEREGRVARNVVHHEPRYPSRIVLPVIP